MKLILIRHARSIANDKKIHQGRNDEWSDTSLCEIGINQAQGIAERLKNEKIDEIYSSPFKRTRETAEKIWEFHPDLKIKIDERIKEKLDEEPEEDLIFRCKQFFNDITKNDKEIILVSHEAVILCLLAISTQDRKKGGELFQEISRKIRNASISIIEKKRNSFERTLIGDVEYRSDK